MATYKTAYMVSDDFGAIRKFYHRRDALEWMKSRPELTIQQVKYKVFDAIDWDNFEPALF